MPPCFSGRAGAFCKSFRSQVQILSELDENLDFVYDTHVRVKDVFGRSSPTTCGSNSTVERPCLPSRLLRRFESDLPLSDIRNPEFIPSINITPFVILLQKGYITGSCRFPFHLWVTIPQVKTTRY